MNNESLPEQSDRSTSETHQTHPIAASLGAASGGIAGAVLGKSVAGRSGAAIGGVVGAIAGKLAGETLADLAAEAKGTLSLGLGADDKEVELPSHYSWEELQTLSKPQVKQFK
jgi:outer membrane lipoprotein SlyB